MFKSEFVSVDSSLVGGPEAILAWYIPAWKDNQLFLNSLKKENDEIKKVIGKLIPGIDQNKKYVYYDAFNEWPRSDRSVDRVDLIDKLK